MNKDKLMILFEQIKFPDEYIKEFNGATLKRIIGNHNKDVYHFIISLNHFVKPKIYFMLQNYLENGFPMFRKTILTLDVDDFNKEVLEDYYYSLIKNQPK